MTSNLMAHPSAADISHHIINGEQLAGWLEFGIDANPCVQLCLDAEGAEAVARHATELAAELRLAEMTRPPTPAEQAGPDQAELDRWNRMTSAERIADLAAEMADPAMMGPKDEPDDPDDDPILDWPAPRRQTLPEAGF